MTKKIEVQQVNFRQRFYTDKDGETYTRLKPSQASIKWLPADAVFAVDEDFRLFEFEPKTKVTPLPEIK